jgi:hypothetical protein
MRGILSAIPKTVRVERCRNDHAIVPIVNFQMQNE